MLTDPNDYPEKTGIDERDRKHPDFPKKILKVFLRPLTQSISEKNLWFETVLIIMVILTGCGEILGRHFSPQWYIILFLSFIVVGLKMFLVKSSEKHSCPIPKEEAETKES